jgi:hypothetical protein
MTGTNEMDRDEKSEGRCDEREDDGGERVQLGHMRAIKFGVYGRAGLLS